MNIDESQMADLIARRKAAERAVEGMPDGPIKEKAFEVAFQHLLTDTKQPVTSRRRRTKTSRKPSGDSPVTQRPRRTSGPQGHLAELVGGGFFDDPKGLPDIVEELRARGHLYKQEDLAKPMLRMTRAGVLRREPRERDRGRRIWVYRSSGSSGNGPR
jgi:hypothetical protein